ncbi:MAG: lipid-binding SYLF domain-containing protein [Acidobacteriota bacterium]|nr:lipid-binding SYLF domain-containing protein [Acidobacteriota bacterium]
MRKQAALYLLLTLALSLSARAGSTREDDIHRIQDSAQIFHEIMGTPDKAIPQDLLESAQCIAIIPSEMKFAFVVGGNYGKGLVTCRGVKSWSAPVFLTVSGGSLGFQIGGSSTDLILVFRGRRGLQKLLSDKFKIGGDASAAAGPVGRSAAAGTDVTLHAEILTYSRSRGVFAGISLSGAVVQPDDTGNAALYGRPANTEDILSGKTAIPPDAMVLVEAVSKATRTPAPASVPQQTGKAL